MELIDAMQVSEFLLSTELESERRTTEHIALFSFVASGTLSGFSGLITIAALTASVANPIMIFSAAWFAIQTTVFYDIAALANNVHEIVSASPAKRMAISGRIAASASGLIENPLVGMLTKDTILLGRGVALAEKFSVQPISP